MSASVVPARAGMSPWWLVCATLRRGGPRASGDEPGYVGMVAGALWWSPRERG